MTLRQKLRNVREMVSRHWAARFRAFGVRSSQAFGGTTARRFSGRSRTP